MAETNEVLPACPCPTTATFLTFSPAYTFTGSPSSEATNLTQRKKEAQLRKAGGRHQGSGFSHEPCGACPERSRRAGHSCPTTYDEHGGQASSFRLPERTIGLCQGTSSDVPRQVAFRLKRERSERPPAVADFQNPALCLKPHAPPDRQAVAAYRRARHIPAAARSLLRRAATRLLSATTAWL